MTFPEESQLRSTLCWVGAVPLPLSDWAIVEFAALFENVKFAFAVPLALGMKVTVKGADCPVARVSGSDIPESMNSLLLILEDEIVTDAPTAVRLPFNTKFDPTVTFPKLSVVGERDNWPFEVPVPANATFRVEFEASDTTAMFPLAGPALPGA